MIYLLHNALAQSFIFYSAALFDLWQFIFFSFDNRDRNDIGVKDKDAHTGQIIDHNDDDKSDLWRIVRFMAADPISHPAACKHTWEIVETAGEGPLKLFWQVTND